VTDDKQPQYAPSDAIDIALADTIAREHWLHPAVRHRDDPRLLAIRAKNRALYLQRRKRDPR
jgi:hypothetical protein